VLKAVFIVESSIFNLSFIDAHKTICYNSLKVQEFFIFQYFAN